MSGSSTARAFYDSSFWNFIEKSSTYVSGLLLSMMLTRWLGPSEYGLYASLMSVAAIVPVLISLGFDRALMVESAKLSAQGDGAGRLRYVISRLVRYRAGLAVLASLIMWIGAPLLARVLHQPLAAPALRLLTLYTACACVTQLFRSLCIGLLRVRIAALIRVATDALTLAGAWIVWRHGWGVDGVIGVFAATSALAVAGFAWGTRQDKTVTPEPMDLRPVYQIGAVAWTAALLGLFLGKHVDILLMNLFGVPSQEIGFYNLALNLFLLGGFFGVGSGPIAQAVFARISVSQREALAAAWSSTLKLLSLVTLPVFIFLGGHVHAVIQVLYTSAYHDAAVYFWVYGAFLLVFAQLGASYFDPLFYAVGKPGYVLMFQIGGGLLNLILDMALIPPLGALGACLATGTAYLASGIAQFVMARRLVGIVPPLAFQGKLLLASLLALGATGFVPGMADGVTGLLVRAGAYALVVLALLYLLKPVESEDVELAGRISPRLHQMAQWFSRVTPVSELAGRAVS